VGGVDNSLLMTNRCDDVRIAQYTCIYAPVWIWLGSLIWNAPPGTITVSAARLWNTLPLNVTSASSISVFRKHLKTNFFSHSFPESAVVPMQWLCHFGHYNRSCYYQISSPWRFRHTGSLPPWKIWGRWTSWVIFCRWRNGCFAAPMRFVLEPIHNNQHAYRHFSIKRDF